MNIYRRASRLIKTSSLTNRAIARLLGVSHTRINQYKKKLEKTNLDWPDIEKLSDSEIEQLLTGLRRQCTKKRPLDYCYLEKEMRRKKMTLRLLWEEYCAEDPATAYGYSSFTYKFNKFKRKVDLTMRQSHRAGECVFVDFVGTTIPVKNADTGKTNHAQIFVAALGSSNYTFAHAVESQKIKDWIEAHNRMFLFLNGVPEKIVTDNLKSAVTRTAKELLHNRTYLELCNYYGVIHIPTRPRHPQDNAKAEKAVQVVTRWILLKLRKRVFFSIEELNQAIAELLWELNERPFQKLPGCRRSWYDELDKPMLRPLPGELFQYAEWTAKQKVPSDYHAYINKHYYSVPHHLAQTHVDARITTKTVEIFSDGKRVACHVRSDVEGGHTTLPEHQTKAHREFANLTPENLKNWAETVGDAASAVVQHQFREGSSVIHGLRACSGLKRLAHEYGTDQFEKACQRAQYIGSLTLTSVKSILKRGLTDLPAGEKPIQINFPLHENVRGSTYYV